jgi:hypothetical protein
MIQNTALYNWLDEESHIEFISCPLKNCRIITKENFVNKLNVVTLFYLMYHPMIGLHESRKTMKDMLGQPIAIRGGLGEAWINITFRPISDLCFVGSDVDVQRSVSKVNSFVEMCLRAGKIKRIQEVLFVRLATHEVPGVDLQTHNLPTCNEVAAITLCTSGIWYSLLQRDSRLFLHVFSALTTETSVRSLPGSPSTSRLLTWHFSMTYFMQYESADILVSFVLFPSVPRREEWKILI